MCEIHLTHCPSCSHVQRYYLAPCARVSNGHQVCGNRRAVLDGPSPLCEPCQNRAHRKATSIWQHTKQTARRIQGALARMVARRRERPDEPGRETLVGEQSDREVPIEEQPERPRVRDQAANLGRRAHSAMVGRMSSLRGSRTRRVVSQDINVLHPWRFEETIEETKSEAELNEHHSAIASNSQQESSWSLGLPIQRPASSVYSTQPSVSSESVWSQVSLPPHIVEELLWAEDTPAVAPPIPPRNPKRVSTLLQLPPRNPKRNTIGLQGIIDEGTWLRTDRKAKS